MKTALQVIIGLASHAAVTILDEPINGLDAGMRKTLYEAVLDSHGEFPRLIMISTHHIEEFQALFESLVVLKDGKLLFHEPMDEIRTKGVWLAGNRNKLHEIMAGHKVLEKSEAGSLIKVMLDAPFSDEWKVISRTGNLAVEKAKMQDYLLNITKNLEVPV
jgi:ABC-2 type transport system ATP-binding protein